MSSQYAVCPMLTSRVSMTCKFSLPNKELSNTSVKALALSFQLMAGFPFLVPLLCTSISLLGTTAAAQSILQGTYQCPPGVDSFTLQQLISILQIPCINPALPTISQDNSIQHWNKICECTSSSFWVFTMDTIKLV